MPVCSKCWDQSCPRTSDITRPCRQKPIASLAAVANADGSYVGLDHLSPMGMTLRAGNLTALAGLGASVARITLSAAEQNFDDEAKINGAVLADLPELLSVCSKRKELIAFCKIKCSRLLLIATDAEEKKDIRTFLHSIEREEATQVQRKAAVDKPRTATEFLESQNPRMGLFNSVGKMVQKHGLTNLVTVEQSYFDPETGKSMQKVEHTITFKDVLELYRTWEVFVQIMCRLGFGSYGGWDPLGCEVYTVLHHYGVTTGQRFITECLNALDTKTVENPVELLTNGRAYMYLNTIISSQASPPKDPATGKAKGASLTDQCKRGPVTKVGEFASIIKQHGAASPCYNYNNGWHRLRVWSRRQAIPGRQGQVRICPRVRDLPSRHTPQVRQILPLNARRMSRRKIKFCCLLPLIAWRLSMTGTCAWPRMGLLVWQATN